MSENHLTTTKTIVFVVMDGRARTDPERASVVEAIDEYVNYERVFKYFKKEYAGYDYCLVPYIAEGNRLNPHPDVGVIDSLKDLINL
ncbi:MAG: hypothetical protein EOM21_16000 [Gammaproteobacteria bacterium]|nr:hypothetical protein [Gammaproteobacteria bacterium]